MSEFLQDHGANATQFLESAVMPTLRDALDHVLRLKPDCPVHELAMFLKKHNPAERYKEDDAGLTTMFNKAAFAHHVQRKANAGKLSRKALSGTDIGAPRWKKAGPLPVYGITNPLAPEVIQVANEASAECKTILFLEVAPNDVKFTTRSKIPVVSMTAETTGSRRQESAATPTAGHSGTATPPVPGNDLQIEASVSLTKASLAQLAGDQEPIVSVNAPPPPPPPPVKDPVPSADDMKREKRKARKAARWGTTNQDGSAPIGSGSKRAPSSLEQSLRSNGSKPSTGTFGEKTDSVELSTSVLESSVRPTGGANPSFRRRRRSSVSSATRGYAQETSITTNGILQQLASDNGIDPSCFVVETVRVEPDEAMLPQKAVDSISAVIRATHVASLQKESKAGHPGITLNDPAGGDILDEGGSVGGKFAIVVLAFGLHKDWCTSPMVLASTYFHCRNEVDRIMREIRTQEQIVTGQNSSAYMQYLQEVRGQTLERREERDKIRAGHKETIRTRRMAARREKRRKTEDQQYNEILTHQQQKATRLLQRWVRKMKERVARSKQAEVAEKKQRDGVYEEGYEGPQTAAQPAGADHPCDIEDGNFGITRLANSLLAKIYPQRLIEIKVDHFFRVSTAIRHHHKLLRIPPSYNGDVSSDEEVWEKEVVLLSRPELPSEAKRRNPHQLVLKCFELCKVDDCAWIKEAVCEYQKVPSVQRRGYRVLRRLVQYIFHAAYWMLYLWQDIPSHVTFPAWIKDNFDEFNEVFHDVHTVSLSIPRMRSATEDVNPDITMSMTSGGPLHPLKDRLVVLNNIPAVPWDRTQFGMEMGQPCDRIPVFVSYDTPGIQQWSATLDSFKAANYHGLSWVSLASHPIVYVNGQPYASVAGHYSTRRHQTSQAKSHVKLNSNIHAIESEPCGNAGNGEASRCPSSMGPRPPNRKPSAAPSIGGGGRDSLAVGRDSIAATNSSTVTPTRGMSMKGSMTQPPQTYDSISSVDMLQSVSFVRLKGHGGTQGGNLVQQDVPRYLFFLDVLAWEQAIADAITTMVDQTGGSFEFFSFQRERKKTKLFNAVMRQAASFRQEQATPGSTLISQSGIDGPVCIRGDHRYHTRLVGAENWPLDFSTQTFRIQRFTRKYEAPTRGSTSRRNSGQAANVAAPPLTYRGERSEKEKEDDIHRDSASGMRKKENSVGSGAGKRTSFEPSDGSTPSAPPMFVAGRTSVPLQKAADEAFHPYTATGFSFRHLGIASRGGKSLYNQMDMLSDIVRAQFELKLVPAFSDAALNTKEPGTPVGSPSGPEKSSKTLKATRSEPKQVSRRGNRPAGQQHLVPALSLNSSSSRQNSQMGLNFDADKKKEKEHREKPSLKGVVLSVSFHEQQYFYVVSSLAWLVTVHGSKDVATAIGMPELNNNPCALSPHPTKTAEEVFNTELNDSATKASNDGSPSRNAETPDCIHTADELALIRSVFLSADANLMPLAEGVWELGHGESDMAQSTSTIDSSDEASGDSDNAFASAVKQPLLSPITGFYAVDLFLSKFTGDPALDFAAAVSTVDRLLEITELGFLKRDCQNFVSELARFVPSVRLTPLGSDGCKVGRLAIEAVRSLERYVALIFYYHYLLSSNRFSGLVSPPEPGQGRRRSAMASAFEASIGVSPAATGTQIYVPQPSVGAGPSDQARYSSFCEYLLSSHDGALLDFLESGIDPFVVPPSALKQQNTADGSPLSSPGTQQTKNPRNRQGNARSARGPPAVAADKLAATASTLDVTSSSMEPSATPSGAESQVVSPKANNQPSDGTTRPSQLDADQLSSSGKRTVPADTPDGFMYCSPEIAMIAKQQLKGLGSGFQRWEQHFDPYTVSTVN